MRKDAEIQHFETKIIQEQSAYSASLQNEIMNVVHNITEDELQQISKNFLHRCEMCVDGDGHHFQQFL